MIALRRFLTWLKRRWRGGGFGIHSPFAFSLVTEALCKKGAAGHDEALQAIGCRDMHFAAVVCRCIDHLKPKSIAIVDGDGSSEFRSIIRLFGDDITIVDEGDSDMAIVGVTSGALAFDTNAKVVLIARVDKEPSRSLWKRLTTTCSRGMDFSDYRIGIICRYSHLPRQSFKIVIK